MEADGVDDSGPVKHDPTATLRSVATVLFVGLHCLHPHAAPRPMPKPIAHRKEEKKRFWESKQHRFEDLARHVGDCAAPALLFAAGFALPRAPGRARARLSALLAPSAAPARDVHLSRPSPPKGRYACATGARWLLERAAWVLSARYWRELLAFLAENAEDPRGGRAFVPDFFLSRGDDDRGREFLEIP